MKEGRENFWSRRQAAVRAEEAAEREAVQQRDAEAEMARCEAMDDADILAELDLADPDSLKLGDDFRAFMAKTVPERLRRRAMRRLWSVNPVLANLDGLNDYDEDYRIVDAGPVRTSYQVGKGLLAHVQELARQAEAGMAALEEDEPAPAAEPEPEPDAEPVQIAAAEEPPEAAPPVPRRMRFEFEG